MSVRPAMRRYGWAYALGLIAALAVAAGLLVVSGVVSVAASSGHWPMMEWFLHFAAKRSVSTQSFGIQTPRLDDPQQQALGAAHYRFQCEHCHGAPGVPPQLTYQSMTPAPPDLVQKIDEWDTGQLYWIVQHGMKYTAMPAWPTQHRLDEAWSVVAFLQRLPQLDGAQYQQLAGATTPRDGDEVSQTLARCAACHGADGEGRGIVPRLAGQSADYLRESLHAYAANRRHSGFMEALAGALDADTITALADHYAHRSMPRARSSDSSSAAAIARGERLVREGSASQEIPACSSCHGDAGRGDVHPRYPALSGQSAVYLAQQLRLFRGGMRGGTAYAPLMEAVAMRLSEAQVDEVAAYLASVAPAATSTPHGDATRAR